MTAYDTTKTRVAKTGFESKLIQGDVVEVLAEQSSAVKFDVVIADPPYNIGKDFGDYQDNMPLKEYLAWTDKWLEQCFSLLSRHGIIYLYGFPEILAHIAVRYPLEEQRWLVWHYTNKTSPAATFWQRSHESILCLWKTGQEKPSLEVDQIREPYTESYLNCAGKIRKPTHSRFNGSGVNASVKKHTMRETIYKAHEGGALPRDVIKIPALAGGAGAAERWFMCHDCHDEVFPPSALKKHRDHHIMKHPTQKPGQLTQRLIASRIKAQNGRVLIPFAGSGSECRVAAKMGIEWLGVELNPQYVAFAQKWIAHA